MNDAKLTESLTSEGATSRLAQHVATLDFTALPSALVTLIFAPGTRAPDGSAIAPLIPPVPCANARPDRVHKMAANALYRNKIGPSTPRRKYKQYP